jgi:hypothetical protein
MTSPGITVLPVRSMTVAASGTVAVAPPPTIWAMVPSRMTIVWFSLTGPPVPSINRSVGEGDNRGIHLDESPHRLVERGKLARHVPASARARTLPARVRMSIGLLQAGDSTAHGPSEPSVHGLSLMPYRRIGGQEAAILINEELLDSGFAPAPADSLMEPSRRKEVW